MSRFKTASIPVSFHNGIVFKRKGNRVRYIDPVTAKVGPWMSDARNAILPKGATWTGTVEGDLARMTVTELRSLAADRGLKIPSKARKADIIKALTED